MCEKTRLMGRHRFKQIDVLVVVLCVHIIATIGNDCAALDFTCIV